ncbi:hypothetical protein [Pacificibacter marinus]|uniref:Uncharacterized protein n=2 Tax=Pacificibacter marinus TaxID=658057 RepID=A0A1Y5RUM4_9RHOB|nr:hypothetical protein [Pacificibacter marinus]SLN23069.1 hypothetical protein PAM7971_00725 [Pacificibacter marinus]SLN23080.1 hypothetical protein PAM7971_00726 [Pacificibacter marinus]
MFNSSVKTLVAAAVLVGAGSAAFASDAIFVGEPQNLKSFVELDLVRATTDGTVDVYELTADGQGKLLGSAPVHAGANQDLKVSFKSLTNQDVVAVLTTNGGVTATQAVTVSE